MGIARKRKVSEIAKSFGAPFSGDDGRTHVTPQNLRDFKVDQMRSVQRFVGRENEAVHTPGRGRL